MLKIYRDTYTPKKKFRHFNILGFKFRVKTYKRERLNKCNIYKDNQGIGLNIMKLNVKLYK